MDSCVRRYPLATDLAFHIGSGSDWFDHRTAACPVTYVMLEGEGALQTRMEAWEKFNNRTVPTNFRAIMEPFHLADPQQVEELAVQLPKGGVVIIDTLNRAMPGLDENSSADMGRSLTGLKRLQEATEGLVLLVHHTGKDPSKGLRGHSSLHAALDGAIEVERTTNGRMWSAAKVKDGEDGQAVPFKLHVLQLGTDRDGDAVTSCAVGPDSSSIYTPKAPSGKNQQAALTAVRRALRASSQVGQAGCGSQTQCMTVEDAVAEVAATLVAVLKHKRTNQARGLVRDLIGGGYLQRGLDANQDGWLWL